MTGDEIITKFEEFVDDALDDTLVLQLANDAIHDIETELDLYICKNVDATHSTTPGQTHTTAIPAPSGFMGTSKPYIYVGQQKYWGVPLADKMAWKDTPYKFYYDPSDGFHLCGTQNSVQTISIPYNKASTDITTVTSPIWPDQFHSLIPMQMAMTFYLIDSGEKERSWAPEWKVMLDTGKQRMMDWDAKLKRAAIGGRTGYASSSPDGIPLSLM